MRRNPLETGLRGEERQKPGSRIGNTADLGVGKDGGGCWHYFLEWVKVGGW